MARGSTPEQVEAALPKLAEYTRAAGRDPGDVPVTVRTGLRAGEDPDATLARLRRYRDLGVTHLCLETGYREMDRAYATLERFARELRPQL